MIKSTYKKEKLDWRSSLASFADATWFMMPLILFSNAMTFTHFKCVLSVQILIWSGWMHCCTNVLHERTKLTQHWQIYKLVSIKFLLLKIWMSAFRSEATICMYFFSYIFYIYLSYTLPISAELQQFIIKLELIF